VRHLRGTLSITLISQEADPFHRSTKRGGTSIIVLGNTDLSSVRARLATKILDEHAKCRVALMPYWFVQIRFAQRDLQVIDPNLVAMICGRRRYLKMLYLTEGRNRVRLMACPSKALDTDFALLGQSRSHVVDSRDSLPLFKQGEAIRLAQITTNFNNFGGVDPHFSDPLSISRSAGMPSGKGCSAKAWTFANFAANIVQKPGMEQVPVIRGDRVRE